MKIVISFIRSRKIVALLLALFSLGATSSHAGTPDPGQSSLDIVLGSSGCNFGSNPEDADLSWMITAGSSWLEIRVTVRDAIGDPVPACAVELTFGGGFSPQGEYVIEEGGYLCGGGLQTVVTDTNGTGAYRIDYGGGCGTMALDFSATALCDSTPILIAVAADTFCVKSSDMNGNGTVNFRDMLEFWRYSCELPQTYSWCSDNNCSGSVNFFDTFAVFPWLTGSGLVCQTERVLLDPIILPACNGPWGAP